MLTYSANSKTVTKTEDLSLPTSNEHIALVLMLLTGLSIALYFRKKGWWGKREE